MPDFNDFVNSLRDDCNSPALAPAADLRRVGGRRKLAYRTTGGLATLVLVAGTIAGFSVLRAGSTVNPPAASSGPATAPRTPSTAPVHPVPTTPGGTADPSHHTTPPPSGTPTSSATPTGTRACTAADFGDPMINNDSASGIIGYDVTLTYRGTAPCRLGQPGRLYYTSGGTLVAFGVAPGAASAQPIIAKHGRHVLFSVFVADHQGDPTPPPSCATQHTYGGLAVKIGSGTVGMGSATLQFPCAGAATTAWSAA